MDPWRSLLLAIEYEGQEYEGILLFQDACVCREIYEVLVQHLGKPIQQIGDIDLSETV
jgi:hypothetical protein